MLYNTRRRLARRRAAARHLDELTKRSATDIASRPKVTTALQFSECAGHTYLIGAGTFLVAAYLRRMRSED
jgi:hypothetical protein